MRPALPALLVLLLSSGLLLGACSTNDPAPTVPADVDSANDATAADMGPGSPDPAPPGDTGGDPDPADATADPDLSPPESDGEPTDAGVDVPGPGLDADSAEDSALHDTVPDRWPPLASRVQTPALVALELPVEDEVLQQRWDPLVGVTLVSQVRASPRPLRLWVAIIDPAAAGLSWVATEANGPDEPRTTTRRTVRDFVIDQDLALGFNTHFFTPWPAEDVWSDLLGLAVAQGERVQPFTPGWQQAFVVDRSGAASIVAQAPDDTTGWATEPRTDPWVAAGASQRIVRGGEAITGGGDLHPRTAIGVREDGLVVVSVVDGRQDGVSEGMTLSELAGLLVTFGVVEGINLDGGGSSTLVLQDTRARVLNRPVGYRFPGTQRDNGANLGVRALALPDAGTPAYP
jgi:hypothetical protein